MHIDSGNYGEAKVGVATSDSICGSYTYVRGFQPLGFQSRDMGLYKDTDGTAYLLTEDVRRKFCFKLLLAHPGLETKRASHQQAHKRLS